MWWRFTRELGEGPEQAAAERISASRDKIKAQYYAFLYSLAEASSSGDERSFRRCVGLARGDPFASQMAALVKYLHDGRKDPAAFIAAFPTSEQQLEDFWALDSAVGPPKESALTGVPGIPLPDGIGDKFLAELYDQVIRDNAGAAREYCYLYRRADGAYAEFMVDRSVELLRDHPDVVLRQWRYIGSCMRLLASDDSVNQDDRSRGLESLRDACRKHSYPGCAEALRVFH